MVPADFTSSVSKSNLDNSLHKFMVDAHFMVEAHSSALKPEVLYCR